MSRRFCMVTTFYPPFNFGGDGIYVRRLANALARRGHQVHVVHDVDAYRLMAGRESSEDYSDHENVVHHGLRRGPGWRLDLVLAHQLGRPVATRAPLAALLGDGFDVIHFHNVSLVGGPRVLGFGGGVKLCTLHDYWFVCPMHTLWRMDREACTRRTCLRCTLSGRRPPQLWRRHGAVDGELGEVDAFIAPSDFSRRTHLESGLAARIVELPNFALPNLAPPSSEQGAGTETSEPPLSSDRPYFLCVSRFERLKGVQDLVEAFRHFDRADLVIAGEGAMGEELRRSADGLGHVRFVGWQSHDALDSLYRGAVAVTIPSLCYEAAFPLVGIEAFAAGTPVVARRIGALAQIDDMGGGWSFDGQASLLEVLGEVLDDSGGRTAQAARAARRLYDERYCEDVHVERYLRLVDEIESVPRGEGTS